MSSSALATTTADQIFMQAANNVRDILALDNMKKASEYNPHYLTQSSDFHHASGFAPQFEVARIFMRNLRLAAEHPSSNPGFEFTAAEVPSTTSNDNCITHAVKFDTSTSRQRWRETLDAANQLKQTSLAMPIASPLYEDEKIESSELRHSTSSAAPPALGGEAPTEASVMAKLQRMQQQLAEANWQPGQPLPASLGDPTLLFKDEMHLLPPPLASMLQSLLAGQAAEPSSSSAAAPTSTIQVEGEDEWED